MSMRLERTWSAMMRIRTSSSWSAPYFRPESSTTLSSTGRTWSISYMFSTPCLMNATRSMPMPVSMFFFGSSPRMRNSVFDLHLVDAGTA